MRPDPAVSQRLQQAAEQLQAAIRSARRRRQSFTESTQQKCSSNGEKAWRLEPTVMAVAKYENCESFSDAEDATALWEQEQSLQHDAESVATSLASISSSQSPMKAEEVRCVDIVNEKKENYVENDMRKALEWMQRDVERRARENRTVRETLARAIHDITDMIVDAVSPETADELLSTAADATGTEDALGGIDNNAGVIELVPDKVDELVNQWEHALVSWREQRIIEKKELVEGFAHFEEECLARMQAGEASHRLEQQRLAHKANVQQMACEDYTSSLLRELQNRHETIEHLQRQVEELSSQLVSVAATITQAPVHEDAEKSTQTGHVEFQDESLQRRILELTAQAKTSELAVLRYEVALTKQIQHANETETRLQMLLEECQARHCHPERLERKTMPGDTIQIYQQKLALLEDRMQDVLQQVACDHEQFEYEQAKWAFEKRQHREKYDEVLDASVKVLKVLIIREKLMKKHERAQQRDRDEIQKQQLELTHQAAFLQGITKEIMQEGAMVLLVQQQLAVLKMNTSQPQDKLSSWTLPAKPVQMKSMIKRLKKLEAALGRREWAAAVESAVSTNVYPYPEHK